MGEKNTVKTISSKKNQMFWSFFENHPDYCYMVSLDGKILDVNDSALSNLGYKKEEIIGKPVISTIYAPSSQKKAKKLLEKWKKTGELVDEELKIKTKKGEERTVLLTADSIRDLKGDILHSISIQRDITDLRRSEEEIKIKNHAIESSINAIAIADLSGNLTYVNSSFIDMWGYKKEEILEKPLIKFWKKKGKTVELIDSVLKEGKWRGEFTAERRNGKDFTVELLANLVKNDKENPICIMASFIDITNRKNAEREIRKTKDHLQNIINSASEIIITVNEKNKVTLWNKSAEYITGYKRNEVMGKPLEKTDVFEKPNDLSSLFRNLRDGLEENIEDIVLKAKDGTKRIIQVNTALVENKKNEYSELLFVGKDITDKNKKHGKLLKGNSYVVINNFENAIDLFSDITRINSKGMVFTRKNPSLFKNKMHFSSDVKILFLSNEKIENFATVSNFDEILKHIKDFTSKNKNSVILFDRVDYLINRFSFDDFINILYKINNTIIKNKSIFIVYISTSFLSSKEIAFIEEELQLLPGQKVEGINLEDELFDILEYINNKNQKKSLVSYKKISKNFGIVKATTAKKLNILNDKGLINIKKQGRLKIVNVSDKGKTLLHKRQII